MVRLSCAVLALLTGLVALLFPLVGGVVDYRSLRFFGYLFQDLLVGDAATLRYVSLTVLGLAALGALVYGACLNDELFRRAAWATTVLFALDCSYRAFEIVTYGNRGAFRIENSQREFLLAVSALFALVVALSKQELPTIEIPALPRRNSVEPGTHSFGLQTAQTSMLPSYVLAAFAVMSVVVAAFLPVITKTVYYSSSKGPALFDYSPAFVVSMLIPLIGVAVGFLIERTDIQKIASGLGAFLTLATLILIARDYVDSANDYTYGLFPVVSRQSYLPDALSWGFWLLVGSGLCWIGIFFSDFKFLGDLPNFARNTLRQRAQRAPIDAAELFQRFLSSTLTFIFCASCFPLGIFLWRYFDEQDNRLVNVALAGWVLGFVFALLRLLLIFFAGASALDD